MEDADDLQGIVARSEENHMAAFGGDAAAGEEFFPETETMAEKWGQGGSADRGGSALPGFPRAIHGQIRRLSLDFSVRWCFLTPIPAGCGV